ncbi:leucine-rich repeat domain-containing protein [Wolbachia endosymbiont (group A) of Andrena haemorrhoa]|uniref:leucine-rich repeat domain-containing protein n=1 Tax=Wolbachia endosymbiont (group A) of Andrena haemorrhoa TaxID=2953976 RepID=UPI0022268842|nr:leucine-rich repeat domain-containing protein [Wolbachia endosymbiont (group A) of Andrena haemorrhoa]
MSFDRYVTDDSLIIKNATTVDIGRLLSFLQSNTHIIRLSLKNCNVGSEVVEELTEPTRLNLLCNKIGDRVTGGLAKLGLYTPSSLMSGYIDNRYTISTKAVKKLAQLKNLTSLDLSGNKIDDEGAKELAKLANLTSLDLSSNKIGYEGVKELAQLKNLTSLNLSGNKIGSEGVKELTKLANLTSLSLVNCGIGYKDIGELAQLKNLTSLNLSSDKVSDKGVKELAKLANLTSLSLISCLISVKGVKELAQFTNLTSLDLSGNEIGSEDVKELAKLTHLTSLSLAGCGIGCKGIGELAQFTNLTSLDLSGNEIGSEDVKELAKLTHLTSLSLAGCGIGCKGIGELAKFANLTSLNLSGNKIDDEGLKALTKSSCLKNLKKLCLGEIKIGIEGIESLAEIKNSGVKLIHSLKEMSHRIFCDFLLKPRPHNQVPYKKGVKKMVFNVAQHDNSGKIVKHILTQPNKYRFLINSQDKQGRTLSHFYTHSPEMQEFLFKHGFIPEKEPELERDAELQGILRDRQSVHTPAAVKQTRFITKSLVESINASENELKQAATFYMENVPKLLERYQSDSVRVGLLSLTKGEKKSVMEKTLLKNQAVPNDEEFIRITVSKASEVLEKKYLGKDPNGEYIQEISKTKLQYDYDRGDAKVTIPECIGCIKLLIDGFSIPLKESKELLVTLANQNPELVKQKLSKIRLELGNNNVSQEQITNRTEFYKLLNNVDGSKVDKLFKEISGLNIEEIWREQKEFVLLKQIYVAATTYGKDDDACTQGTWSQIINSVREISSEISDQLTQSLDKEREQEKQRNSITAENIVPFVEDLAKELIQYVEGNLELKDALLGFAVASTNINEPKEITFKEQKIFAMISQKFCKDIKKYLPNYDRNIPKEDEYKIIIEKLPEVKNLS